MNEEDSKKQVETPADNAQESQVTETPVTTVDSTPKVDKPLVPTSPVATENSVSLEEIQGLWNKRQEAAKALVDNMGQRVVSSTKGYDDILNELRPDEPEVLFDADREQSRMNLANIGTAISSIANLVGAANGAVAFKPSNLSEAAQKRYETLYKMSQDNRERYNKAMERAQDTALSLAKYNDTLRRQRMQDIEAYDKARLGIAEDEYGRAIDRRNMERQEANDYVNNAYKMMTGQAAVNRAATQGTKPVKEDTKEVKLPTGDDIIIDGKNHRIPKTYMKDLFDIMGSKVDYSDFGFIKQMEKLKELLANATPEQIQKIQEYNAAKAELGFQMPELVKQQEQVAGDGEVEVVTDKKGLDNW